MPKPTWPASRVSAPPTETKWAEPACGQRLSSSMQVDRSGAPQSVALASPTRVATASAALAPTRKAGFRRSRIAGELITGLVAWYGALVADGRSLVLGSASPRRRDILERLGV